ncbi:hypothetical protein AAY473_026105 [Plecturocebus cupreus]
MTGLSHCAAKPANFCNHTGKQFSPLRALQSFTPFAQAGVQGHDFGSPQPLPPGSSDSPGSVSHVAGITATRPS